jgi:hypothetical protein
MPKRKNDKNEDDEVASAIPVPMPPLPEAAYQRLIPFLDKSERDLLEWLLDQESRRRTMEIEADDEPIGELSTSPDGVLNAFIAALARGPLPDLNEERWNEGERFSDSTVIGGYTTEDIIETSPPIDSQRLEDAVHRALAASLAERRRLKL